MKTTLLLTTCLFAAGGMMVNKPTVENKTAAVTAKKVSNKRATAKPSSPMYIVIDKRKYELSVYDAKGWYATYPVVFGNNSLADKKMEGDRNTPEGEFKINQKNVHAKWDRYLGINYPTPESIAKFNARKQRGEVPGWAKPGGAIGIHGTWPGEDFTIDRYKNWTNGCIAMKRNDVEDLYSYVPMGTPVVIRK